MGFLHKVTEMPWATTGIEADQEIRDASGPMAKRIALFAFLGVASSLFLLFGVAYVERMELGDWDPVAEPTLLWVNTALLLLASLAMQGARNRTATGISPGLMLTAGGGLAVLFLIGQTLAWQGMADQGYYSLANPAWAFFLLLTSIHALHLLGGLYVWLRSIGRMRRGASPDDLKTTMELCAIYWHYLLLVWVGLFILMLAN